MPTLNINLTDHLERFIDSGVASGRYGDASEVVREGLRLLEQRDREHGAKLAWLLGAVKEGRDQIDRGEGIEFHSMDDLEAYIHRLGEDASAEIAAGQVGG